jgi:hypothetical protein
LSSVNAAEEMTHPALQAQWAGPGVDEKRGAGVAQRVTASPWHARSFGGRNHHAVAQIARPQPRAAGADEQQLGFAAIGRESGEPLGEVTTDRDRAPPVPGLRAGELTVDDRAAHMDSRGVRPEIGVHYPQGDRLGDPQTGRCEQFEQRSPIIGDLGEQSCQLLAGEEATLVELVGTTAPARLGSKITGSSLSPSRPARAA